MTTDQILNYDENILPKEVVIEDKTVIEQMQLLEQLDEEDKSIVFKMIDKMLTSKKVKDFFAKTFLLYVFNKNLTVLFFST